MVDYRPARATLSTDLTDQPAKPFVGTANAALPLSSRGFREPTARSAQFATSFANALPPHHICQVEREAFQGCDGWRGVAVPTPALFRIRGLLLYNAASLRLGLQGSMRCDC